MSAPPIVDLEPIENPGFRDLDPNGVIEQPFWERYNRQLEMPIGIAISIFTFVAAVAVLMVIISINWTRSKAPVPISVVGGGIDDSGDGSPSDGGAAALASGQMNPAELNKLLQDTPLNDVKDVKERIVADVGGEIEIPDGTAASLAKLDKDIRDKLLGGKEGTGKGVNGGEAAGGSGPGGTGASSTWARGLRWVLKFDTSTGKDYVNQIGGLGGAIMVPIPPTYQKMLLFRDPRTGQSTQATDADFEFYGKLIQFSDARAEAVTVVAQTLGLNFKPHAFWAYFPRDLEDKLATLEKNYQNKPAEQIKQTTFRVILRGGQYDFAVIGQVLR
jgi:hypothetical protein